MKDTNINLKILLVQAETIMQTALKYRLTKDLGCISKCRIRKSINCKNTYAAFF